MAEENNKQKAFKKKINLRIIDCSFMLVVVLNLLILMVVVDILNRTIDFSFLWDNIIILALVLLSIGSIFLINMLRSLSRSIGGIRRIDEVLNKFIEGDHSLRISVRKKDYLRDVSNTLNRLLDNLNAKVKSE